MSGKLPRIDSGKALKVLNRLGFRVARQSGSHMILRILKSILNDLGISVEEFKALLTKH